MHSLDMGFWRMLRVRRRVTGVTAGSRYGLMRLSQDRLSLRPVIFSRRS